MTWQISFPLYKNKNSPNFLNLPTQIGPMSLLYDATGRKWFKYGEFGTTSYASGIEYLDGKLEAIYAPDGRMVAEYIGGTITRYRAEYFHQDHLGNTRLVFSDFNLNGIVDLEEDDPATPLNGKPMTKGILPGACMLRTFA